MVFLRSFGFPGCIIDGEESLDIDLGAWVKEWSHGVHCTGSRKQWGYGVLVRLGQLAYINRATFCASEAGLIQDGGWDRGILGVS